MLFCRCCCSSLLTIKCNRFVVVNMFNLVYYVISHVCVWLSVKLMYDCECTVSVSSLLTLETHMVKVTVNSAIDHSFCIGCRRKCRMQLLASAIDELWMCCYVHFHVIFVYASLVVCVSPRVYCPILQLNCWLTECCLFISCKTNFWIDLLLIWCAPMIAVLWAICASCPAVHSGFDSVLSVGGYPGDLYLLCLPDCGLLCLLCTMALLVCCRSGGYQGEKLVKDADCSQVFNRWECH